MATSEGADGGHNNLGRAVRLARTARDLKRRDVAQRTGLSYPYLSQIERGVRTPSSRALQSIADALDMSVSELLTMADQVGDATPSEALRSMPPPQRARSHWFAGSPPPPAAAPSAAPSSPPPPAARAPMSAPRGEAGQPLAAAASSAPAQDEPTDADVERLVDAARALSRDDVLRLVDLARRLAS